MTERPDWLPSFMPTWVCKELHPAAQLVIMLALYAFHLLFLSKNSYTFPTQLIPNDKGAFQSVGYDSIAGLVVIAMVLGGRKLAGVKVIPKLLDSDDPPWRVPKEAKKILGGTTGMLLLAYVASGYGAVFCEQVLFAFAVFPLRDGRACAPMPASCPSEIPILIGWGAHSSRTPRAQHVTIRLWESRVHSRFCRRCKMYRCPPEPLVLVPQVLLLLSVYNVPLTIPTMRAWKVLLGHLMWVYMGISILGTKHKPFFPPQGRWLRWRTRTNWVWWVTGSYFVSALLFNCADTANQFLLPSTIFDEESVVSKLVNPENKDLLAMAVGAVGPCISAPIFEEVLYRGFLLPALSVGMRLPVAIPVSSVLFAVHHLNLGGIIPLSVLGFAWAVVYTQSRNLLVTILIHALWNSRVFLGSFRSLFIPGWPF